MRPLLPTSAFLAWAVCLDVSAAGTSGVAPSVLTVDGRHVAMATASEGELPAAERARLAAWYAALGAPKAGERFGELVGRTALVQLGKPYFAPPPGDGPATLTVRLEDFECVTLVESSLAVARCLWGGRADDACFVREIERLRYRGGMFGGFASKMHYFAEWIEDNAQRQHVRDVTQALGGRPIAFTFDYLSRQAHRYPPLADPPLLEEIRAIEARLSASRPVVLDRGALPRATAQLETGDVLAFVGTERGLLVTHVGLVWRDGAAGPAHLVHASSYHGRVIVTRTDVADYVLRRPERLGLMVARPLAPDGIERAPSAKLSARP